MNIKWMNLHTLALMVALCGATACSDDDDSDQNLNQQDRDFIEQAAYGNRGEVELGALATQRGEHDGVQWFGEHMQNEHGAALDELESIASDKDASWPEGLNAKNQAIKDHLSTLSAFEFDTAYMRSQVKAHNETIALFESEIDNGNDDRVQQYAEKYLPHIKMHLHHADSILDILEEVTID